MLMDRARDVKTWVPAPPSRFPPDGGETGHVEEAQPSAKVKRYSPATCTTTQSLPHHGADQPPGGLGNNPGLPHCSPGSSFHIIHSVTNSQRQQQSRQFMHGQMKISFKGPRHKHYYRFASFIISAQSSGQMITQLTSHPSPFTCSGLLIFHAPYLPTLSRCFSSSSCSNTCMKIFQLGIEPRCLVLG